ncbi:MAG TPA: phage major capsid protein [Pseudolabrys sp.]|jgi:HK97 family phage major capsid protein|nr:phage major capsid protein [Pseudolabrys sp.]
MDIETENALEIKAGVPDAPLADAAVTYADLMRAFEDFKQTNDQKLSEKRSVDVVLEEKLARLDSVISTQAQRLEAIELKQARPAIGSEKSATKHENQPGIEHKAAFEAYVRAGESGNLRALEAKALSGASAPDGGFLVPPEIEAKIGERLFNISPIRSLASVRTISSNIYKKPMMAAGANAGWVGETDARTQTATPTLDELSFPAMELYAMPAATTALLEDSAVSIEEWLSQEVDRVFAAQEGAAFVSGDGSNKPKGFLSYSTVANTSWTWGNIGYVASGVAGAFPSTAPSDVLIDLILSVKAGYRQNAVFLMNRSTQSTVRKFKDSTGNYLWQPPAMPTGRASLMNFPLYDVEDMPDVSANAFAIAFGDFNRGYLVVDRAGVTVLRDPYTAKPYVLFYTTKRVGGGVQDYDAIKLLKFAVS